MTAGSIQDKPDTVAAGVDRALVEAVQAGDRGALADLYDRYAPNVYALAMRVLRNPSEAENLVSDVFFEVWSKPDRFDASRGPFRSYLLMMTRSRAIDRLRSAAVRSERTAQAVDEAEPERRRREEALAPPVDAIAAERRERVRVAVERLTAEQREPLELAYFEGLTHAQIAERLQAPLGTVKTRIRTALKSLRTALSALEGPDALS